MEKQARGVYFAKVPPALTRVPRYEEGKKSLPLPLYEEKPGWIDLYWKAWEIAFRNFHDPAPGSPMVSPFIDAAFNENIFLWDSCFMTMFCDVAHPLVPGISTLDNFYALQHEDGEISREIRRDTGEDFAEWQNRENIPLFSRWGYGIHRGKKRTSIQYVGREAPAVNPRLTLDGLNHPILAWSELEHYRWSRDKERLRAVWEPLLRFYRALQEYLRQGNGLFVTDWASMDNSPRNEFLDGGGTGVDISSEMVLMARQLADISGILGMREEAALLRQEAEVLAALINRLMWDDAKGFYVDLMRDGRPSPVRTVAAYWTLLAGVATPERARRLADELSNPVTFGRLNPVPTCAGDEPGFKAHGGYWRGAVWAPTNTMVIRGLEKYGYGELAREIALKHLALVADVYSQTGTIWENYAPDLTEPGTIFAGLRVRKDFVGWSGIGPILYLLEYAIGLRASAPDNRLTWIIGSESRCGCERFRFAGHVVSLVAEKAGAAGTRLVRISSDGEFRLSVSWRGRTKESAVRPGESELVV